ncbi:hypothetical protein Tco_0361918, partial [Tanacetum coccineum]
ISEGAPAVTESLLPHQIPLPDTSDSNDETLFDHVDNNVFDTYNAPAVTESLLPHQIPLPDTSDSDDETLFDHVDSNEFDTYNAPETDSEASSSNSVNIDILTECP